MEPSLLQGTFYKNKKYYEKKPTKEFFSNLGSSNTSLANTKCSKSESQIKQKVNSLIQKYQDLLNQIKEAESSYNYRTNNIYLNKNIQFNNNVFAYVTKAGIVKKYPSLSILQQNASLNGCPPPIYMNVNIAWADEYDIPGAAIQMPTVNNSAGPKLRTGSPMIAGKSCGFEGSEIMVSQENDTPISKYLGCYNNPVPYPTASQYMGNQEPYQNFIANGNFFLPASAANSATALFSPNTTALESWSTTTSATIVSTLSSLYPVPYPSSNKVCVSLLGTQSITQTIDSSLSPGTYTLTLSACGYYSANPLNILFNGVSIFAGSNYLTPSMSWQSYQYTYNVQQTATNVVFTIAGTDTTNTMYSAITNIRLTNNTPNPLGTNAPTFEQCQSYAQSVNAPYFGFQVPSNSTNGQGYCSINNSTSGSFFSNLTAATSLSPQILYSSGTTTSPNIGVSAGVTSTGQFVVYTSSNNSTFVAVSTNTPLSSTQVNNVYLILTDSGYMKLYSGGTPGSTSNPGTLLWSSNAPTVQVAPNKEFAAANGLTGLAYITPSTNLSPGDFIGSPSGSVYLKMESNGNLNLYTSSFSPVCSKSSSGNNMQGTIASTALYKVNTATDNLFTYLGKLFFVSSDSNLQNFSADNLTMSNNYLQVPNYNNPGTSYNLSTDTSSYKTAALCQAACSTNSSCYGYSFTPSTASCQLKGSAITGDIGGPAVPGTSLYIRQQMKTNSTSNATPNQVASTQMQNYNPGQTYQGNDPNNIKSILQDKRNQLSEIQEEINELMQELVQCEKNSNTYSPAPSSGNQQYKYHNGSLNYIFNEMDRYQNQINTNEQQQNGVNGPSLDNMVSDTNIRVMEESNKYMLWGVVAAASVLLSIGVSKM